MSVKSYEEIPYSSQPVKRSDLESMRVVAHLFGIESPETKTARVLEVGTGDGGNVFALASSYPDTKFVGIDNSKAAIEKANATAKELKLDNVEFELVGIENYAPEHGSFDYIIAHGVHSWVPDEIKAALMKLYRLALSENGVGYISYNCLPGWHQRGLTREFMKFHIADIESPKLQIAQARAATQYLADNATPKDLIYRLLTSHERDTVQTLSDFHLFHDHLEENNDPRYFLSFVQELNDAGLQYLADSELFQMLPLDLPPNEQERLSKVAKDPLRLEQYLDFFRNRMFRRSLIVQAEKTVIREFKRETILPLWLRSKMKRASSGNAFVHPNGGGMTAPNQEIANALQILSERSPDFIPFQQIAELAGANSELQQNQLAGAFLQAVISDLIEARTCEGPCKKAPTQTPKTSQLARAQATKNEIITNLSLDQIQLRRETNLLLTLVDGTKDISAFAKELNSVGAFRLGATETEMTALIKVWLKELGEMELLR
jgi:methyltransferase-like protein/ubiquinone/menaquinone biosynthesis C-methylase UbiE